MRIDFWSDIICPWCGLMEHRLTLAVERFAHSEQVEVVHRSFPLHSDLPVEGITQRQLSKMHGMTDADTESVLRPIELMAERDGLQPYNALDRTLGPTGQLHEMLAFATEQGKHSEAWHTAFRQHFGDGRNLWSIDDIVAFASDIGINPVAARDTIGSGRFRHSVERDQREAQELGASGTPFMLIDGHLAIYGARDVNALVAALDQAWAAAQPVDFASMETGGMSLPDDGVCLPGSSPIA
ncbi:DsbA family protein [Arthrobacter sp. NicSoilB8]|uniref:DsbA family oxidoreductase n=1 Tax=Arthrobacter sp. NicSoilB8 TaxID=2830998 RepID=UPI001CC5E10F|nr:DsbA family protein [Arthrobacter sp. NicSoilB8]